MIILHLYVCVSNVELIRTKMIHEERESGQERQKEQSRKIYEDIEKKKERKKERTGFFLNPYPDLQNTTNVKIKVQTLLKNDKVFNLTLIKINQSIVQPWFRC